jgi:hypothetical protein
MMIWEKTKFRPTPRVRVMNHTKKRIRKKSQLRLELLLDNPLLSQFKLMPRTLLKPTKEREERNSTVTCTRPT